jgi:hypothetical protein
MNGNGKDISKDTSKVREQWMKMRTDGDAAVARFDKAAAEYARESTHFVVTLEALQGIKHAVPTEVKPVIATAPAPVQTAAPQH